MKQSLAALLAFLSVLPARADTMPDVGKAAPAFSATDLDGKTVDLSQFRGRIVVLEWTNKDCPFVHKMYDSGAMQALQKQATAQGIAWISIVSSAPGHEGYVDAAGEKKVLADWNAHPSDVILDPKGTIGHLYAAKTTPDMYVIDKAGMLVYEGAIDDHPSTDKSDIAKSRNYVRLALDALEQGKPVTDPVTVSYGCSVKYGE